VLSDLTEELAALAIANDIQLRLDRPASPPAIVAGNEEHLYQLMLNIVSNALQHTPPGGQVSIQMKRLEREVVVTIADTGAGIPLADLHRIFDRFYRVDKNRSRHSGGSGLGLSIALAIAQAHGGSIRVKSQVGKGSTFAIRLPILA
ncbi:MAG: ATP-binding protein, partial [Cyanobacteria bacterium J06648_11]